MIVVGDMLEIRCAIHPFLVAAGVRWGRPVSQNQLALATGLNLKTVTRLGRETLADIELRTVGLVCAFFWCRPSEILTLGTLPEPQQVLDAVRRPQRPETVEPLRVINHVPALLASYETADLAARLGLARTTAWRLQGGRQRGEATTQTRLSAEALAALFRLFDTTDIGQFVTVELPSEAWH